MVRLDNVGKRYGSDPEVLADVSLRLVEGGFYFLTGPSGAGKSTLLKIIYLAERPSRGIVTLFGLDLSRPDRNALPGLRRRIGVVFQDFRLIPHLSVRDNVALPLRVRGTPEAEIQENVPELLRWVGLGERLDARPATLSGGEQQRVAIARAVVARPELIVADEPTGNVEEQMAERILALFVQLNRLGTTVLIATHSEELPRHVVRHRRLHIEAGRLSVPAELVQPKPTRRGLVQDGIVLPGLLQGGPARDASAGAEPVPPGSAKAAE